ncbi:UDP-4-amino-4,6-dideoxy-N-acetyl-beta-L-altrosamine transaminase [Granulosicoccaceae sp. 1_MG-2023]|nr:UDP-4-amino-4,6-dideoxy-N-acetyl-beta-L-altrosamine transaminase [Granulosicoccaceae sp. 1_MG-2023]
MRSTAVSHAVTPANPPAAEFIPYGRQSISDADIQAVVDVLRSPFLTQGPLGERFEEAIAGYCGAQYGVAVNSATSALHIACLALGVGPGEQVWTTPVTFVASANCALYCGAAIDFVDIDPATGNIDPQALHARLRQAQSQGSLPRAVIAVHLAGLSCEMKTLHRLCRDFGVALIEDASHAIGARYDGAPVGSCRYSDITVFSFHPVKIITTGEGGMALTNKPELAKKMTLLRSHHITRDAADMTHEPDGPWYYQQTGLGFNYRMTDIQAALGLSQHSRIDEFVARRNVLARRYHRELAALPLTLPCIAGDSEQSRSALHLYVVRLQDDDSGRHRRVFEALRARGIGVNLHYIPVHLQPYFRQMGFAPGDFPHAERYYRQAISLPLYPGLTEELQDRVIAALAEVLI